MTVVDLRELPAPDRGARSRAAASGPNAAERPPAAARAAAAGRHPPRRGAGTASASCWPGTGATLAGLRRPLPRPRRLDRRCTWWSTRGASRRPALGAGAAAARRRRRRRRPARSTSGSCRRRPADDERAARRGLHPRARPAPDARPPPAARRRGGGDPAAGHPALRRRPRRGRLGRDQQPRLRRPPRAGRRGPWRSSASAWPPTGSTSTGSSSPTTRTGRASSGPAGPRSTATAPGARRDLRDRRRPAPPRAGLGPLPHRGRPGVTWPAGASRSGCSTPTPPTRRRWRSTAHSASRVDHIDRSYRRDPAGSDCRARRPAQLTPVPMALPDPEGDAGRHHRHRQLAQGGDHHGPLGETGQHDADDHRGHARPGRPRARWPWSPR